MECKEVICKAEEVWEAECREAECKEEAWEAECNKEAWEAECKEEAWEVEWVSTTTIMVDKVAACRYKDNVGFLCCL